MGAKVKWYRGAWHVDIHHARTRKKKRVGPTKADKREAEQIAKKVNAKIALGSFTTQPPAQQPLHLLRYTRAKLDAGAAVATIQTQLSILRRVLSLAHQEGRIERNPAARLGALMRRVDRRTAAEATEAEKLSTGNASRAAKSSRIW